MVNALSAAQAMSQTTSYDWASPYGTGGGNGIANGIGGGIEEEEDRLLANLSSAAGLRGGGGAGLGPLPLPHHARFGIQTPE